MTSTFTPDSVSTHFVQMYPEETDGRAKTLAVQFCNDFTGLKALVAPLRQGLKTLPDSDKTLREVPLPSGEATLNKLCRLAHNLVRSDRYFDDLTYVTFTATHSLGEVQRECRKADVPLTTRSTDVAWLKKLVCEARGWGPQQQQPGGGSAPRPEQQYAAEEILGDKVYDGVHKFLVQWAGTEEVTWEPRENLLPSAAGLLRDYELRQQPPMQPPVGLAPQAPSDVGAVLAGLPAALAAAMTAGMAALAKQDKAPKKPKRKSRLADTDSDSEDDDRASFDRPALRGDKRQQKIGFTAFRAERGLKRQREMTEMQPHEPFAAEYNEANSALVDIEMRMLDQDLKIQDAEDGVREAEADDFEAQAAAEQDLIMAKARRKVLREQWMISEDNLELYDGCSRLSRGGKHTVAVAMLQDYKKKSRETSKDAAFNKRQKLAEARLKKERELDQGFFLSQQLGSDSASGPQLGWRRNMYGTSPVYPSRTFSDFPAYPPPPVRPGPRPLPIEASPAQLAQIGAGPDGRRRTMFEEASTVLQPCPPKLVGVMLPVGMKFFTDSKLLSDPRKDRSVKPFPGKCKLCDKAGHEAFECEETFTVDGRKALSYRACFKQGLCDQHGQYK